MGERILIVNVFIFRMKFKVCYESDGILIIRVIVEGVI
jgi:hypothetical protein